jgi:Coenzyme PQQ synthesis protein D (PqqD)
MSDDSAAARVHTRSTDVIETEIAGDIVLLHTGNWQYFEFDKTGTAIWRLLETPRTVASLVEALQRQFEVDALVCRGETQQFLDEITAHGLVTRGGD